MKPRELNQLLLDNFPELLEPFNEDTSWADGLDTGSTVVYEDVFMPFVEVMVDTQNLENCSRISKFIEMLSFIDDEYVQMVLAVSILESFADFVDSKPFVDLLQKNSLEKYNKILSTEM